MTRQQRWIREFSPLVMAGLCVAIGATLLSLVIFGVVR